MKILVTGAAGYIGSVVVEKLLANGFEVVAIDDLRDGNLAAIPPDVHFYQGDYGDAHLLKKLFNLHQIHLVIHLAASANVPDSVSNPYQYYQNNFVNSLTLLKSMQEHQVKKIIFSSTAAVYGEPQFQPMTEQHPLHPVNPYGFSKLFVEQWLANCQTAYGINFIAFRYFCAAGATQLNGESRNGETHLIPLVIDKAIGKRETLVVYGNQFDTKDGTGVRDYIHVADIAQAHILAITHFEKAKNNVLNLGTGTGYSVLEIIATAEKVLNRMIEFSFAEKRPGDPASLIASAQQAFELMGWKPMHDLASMIASAAAWRSQPKY